MSDRTLYRRDESLKRYVPVEPVDVVEMADHIDGWFTVSNVYAPDLPKASYRVAIVIVEDDDDV